MSTVNNGPQIVRSGLVLNLDAGNGKSYSTNRFQALGSGTVTTNVTFAINGDGTFQRVASGTVIGGYTIRPNDVVYSYVLGANGCHYHGNVAPIPSGVYVTFSFDYLVTGATTYPSTSSLLADIEIYGGSALYGNVVAANSLQNVWQRASFTVGPTSAAGTQAMFLYPGGCGTRLADSGTIYYRNPKVEWTNVDTGNSTFNSTSNIGLWYDLSGNGYNGTLTNSPTSNVSNKGNILFDGSTQYVTTSNIALSFTTFSMECLVKYTSLSGNQGLFTYNNTNVINLWKGSGVGMRWEVNTSGQAITGANDLATGVWYHFVGVYNGSQGILYRNGIVYAGPTTLTSHTSEAANFEIGRYNGAGNTNGNIAIARFYTRALTAAEVVQNYEATKTKFGL
jgi:hypothetical protein